MWYNSLKRITNPIILFSVQIAQLTSQGEGIYNERTGKGLDTYLLRGEGCVFPDKRHPTVEIVLIIPLKRFLGRISRVALMLQPCCSMRPAILVQLLSPSPNGTPGLLAFAVMVDLALLRATAAVDKPGYPAVGFALLSHY